MYVSTKRTKMAKKCEKIVYYIATECSRIDCEGDRCLCHTHASWICCKNTYSQIPSSMKKLSNYRNWTITQRISSSNHTFYTFYCPDCSKDILNKGENSG